MNQRGGWALIKSTWLSWLQHPSFFFLVSFLWMMPSLIYLFVWSTAAGERTVGGLTRGGFVAYYLLLIVVGRLTSSGNNWTVGDAIRYGRMNVLLLRPMSPVYDALASEAAGIVVRMAFAIPLAIILALILRPELHVLPRDGAAFVPALALAWALRFFWDYWLALLSFWATRANALLALQASLVFLLAGQVAPTALLPEGIRQAATVLPFRYMLGFPVEVLMGQLDASALLTGFLFQAGWLLVAFILFLVLWRSGIRRYSAVGG